MQGGLIAQLVCPPLCSPAKPKLEHQLNLWIVQRLAPKAAPDLVAAPRYPCLTLLPLRPGPRDLQGQHGITNSHAQRLSFVLQACWQTFLCRGKSSKGTLVKGNGTFVLFAHPHSSMQSRWSWGRCLGAGPPASAPKRLKEFCTHGPMLVNLPGAVYSALLIAKTWEKIALCLHLAVLTQLMHTHYCQ